MKNVKEPPFARENLCSAIIREIHRLISSDDSADKSRLEKLKQTYGVSDKDLRALLKIHGYQPVS